MLGCKESIELDSRPSILHIQIDLESKIKKYNQNIIISIYQTHLIAAFNSICKHVNEDAASSDLPASGVSGMISMSLLWLKDMNSFKRILFCTIFVLDLYKVFSKQNFGYNG